MSLRQIAPVVGAIVGYVIGGPTGAQYGWMLGSAAGNAWDPPTIRGPSVGDISQQTAQEGGPRPIVFGLSPPMAGNIIATGDPITVKTKKSQGKGGPKVTTETVYRTYAIGVCEGPIHRFVRVWRNGTLVWNNQVDTNFIQNSKVIRGNRIFENRKTFEDRADFYLGGFDQVPAPALEIWFGVGTTPSFKGTAYMLMIDDDVTDMRGAIPQYMFQVERCEGTYLTSRVYAIEDVEALLPGATLFKDLPNPQITEALGITSSLQSGTHRDLLAEYGPGDPEALDIVASLQSGTHRDILLEYGPGDPEALDIVASLRSGTHVDILIEYMNYPPEALNVTASLQSGSLV